MEETAMGQATQDADLIAAQGRLLRKRAELGVTVNHTRLTENFKIPKLEAVEPKKAQAADLCQHGMAKNYCDDCAVERGKNSLRDTLSNITPLIRQACAPAKYFNSTFDNFIGNEKLIDELKKHEIGNLVLYGNTGCGKTHLAVAMMRQAIITDINRILGLNWEWNNKPQILTPRFVPAPELLLEIRQSFRDGSPISEADVIKKYCEAGLLILDDLGSEKTSEYSITTLYIIIDRRDRELLPTIITTNLSQKEVEEKLGARIASRLAGMKNIKINMPDYRKKRG